MASALLRVVVCALVCGGWAARAHVLLSQAEAPPPAEEGAAEEGAAEERAAQGGLAALRSCWADDARRCEDAVAGLLGRGGDVRLGDFAVLAATNASEEEVAPAAAEEEGRGAGVHGVLRQVGRLLRARELRLSLGNFAEVSARLAPGQPDSLEIALDAVDDPGTDGQRSTKRMQKVIIPLLLGFKLTGALILGITVVKMFLVKAFVVSKLALLAALFMMIRRLLSSVGVQHHPYLYSQHKLPAYSLDAGYPAAAASDYGYGYSATPYHTGYYGDYGHYAAAATPSENAAGGAGAGDDLQGHFSTNTIALQNSPATNRTGAKMVSRTDGLKHSVYGLVKSSSHRVPVNTYRKLVTTGRKMAP